MDFMAISEDQWQKWIYQAPEEPTQPEDAELSITSIQNLMLKEGYDKRHVFMIENMGGKGLKFADRIAKRFIDREANMYYLYGIRGTGKTQMAARIAFLMKKALLGVGTRVLVSEYLKALKSSYNGNAEQKTGAERKRERMINAHLLVLDEFSELKADNEHDQQELNLIVDKRYANMRPTLIIGNDKPGDAMNILGPSIWSRLQEEGGSIHCDWRSYREAGQ